jgi:hypothetical protein
MRIWIMDHDNTPQRFPLQRLITTARHCSHYEEGTCRITRARGYGESIRSLEIELDEVDSLVADLDNIENLALGESQWFYDLEVELPAIGLRLGLHDSTALFVESADEALACAIASKFQHTSVAESRRP